MFNASTKHLNTLHYISTINVEKMYLYLALIKASVVCEHALWRQAGSMVSIYSGEHGDVEVKGSIQLALNYVQKLGEFHIFVVHCRELAVADPKKNRSNP